MARHQEQPDGLHIAPKAARWRKTAETLDDDLMHADLTGADLSGADLKGARLLVAKLTDTKLDGADLAGTIMPDGTTHE